MTNFETAMSGGTIQGGAAPLIFLINGSGISISLIIGFLLFTAYMIGQEAKR